MNITTILPVSRLEYLDRVLDSLVKQSYEPRTDLLVVVDGSNELFLRVRNKVASIPLNNVLCVQSTNEGEISTTIPQRRQRISNIHNQMRELISDNTDYVFSIEDDGILPENALSWLVNDMDTYKAAAMITGVELGRWGVPYVGAWVADNAMDVQRLESLESRVGMPIVEEIDACGLYCALIRADVYKAHEFNSDNGLGPDVNMGLEFRQLGWKNYIDWFVPVTHMTTKNGIEKAIPADSKTSLVRMHRVDEITWTAEAT